jgi:hypothetical protein
MVPKVPLTLLWHFYGTCGFRLRFGAIHCDVYKLRIPSSSIPLDSPCWADYKSVFNSTIDTLWYHRYHGYCMVPVVLGLGMAHFILKYIQYGYRRVAYHWIRLAELITKVCLVWPLTPYGTIGTTETFMVPVVLGLGLARHTLWRI